MAMVFQISGDGTLIFKGDEKVIEKAGEFDVSSVDVSRYRADAGALSRLFNDAESRGKEKAQEYVALKAKFIERQALIQLERNKPKVSHAPRISTAAIRGL